MISWLMILENCHHFQFCLMRLLLLHVNNDLTACKIFFTFQNEVATRFYKTFYIEHTSSEIISAKIEESLDEDGFSLKDVMTKK